MFERTVSGITLTLLLIGMLTLAFNIQPVEAGGTIYIRADGSIDPDTAPISSDDNVTYTFTSNINDSIVVERDNIVVDGAGYMVQGTGSGVGIELHRGSVTLKNIKVTNFEVGIFLFCAHNNVLTGNTASSNRVYGIILALSCNNNLTDNTALNSSYGITVRGRWGGIAAYSNNNTISGNNVANNRYGIWLYDSSNNNIAGNNITNNLYGISIWNSSNNTLSDNIMNGNKYNLGVGGPELSHFTHSIDVSNLMDGKPVYYVVNQKDLVINTTTYPQVGYLGFINSTNITVDGLTLTNNGQGLLLAYTNNSRITDNTITNNGCGIYLSYSSNNNTISGNNVTNNVEGINLEYSSNYNTISGNNVTNNDEVGIALWRSNGSSFTGNTISENSLGLALEDSKDNIIYHNNFVDNTWYQVFHYESTNVWDNGYPSGGNYWSDHTEPDAESPYGIVDNPYVIDENNTDNYPLTSPYEYWSDPIQGDINKDTEVDWRDLLILAQAYGSEEGEPSYVPEADFDSNGEIDWKDLKILAMNYGES